MPKLTRSYFPQDCFPELSLLVPLNSAHTVRNSRHRDQNQKWQDAPLNQGEELITQVHRAYCTPPDLSLMPGSQAKSWGRRERRVPGAHWAETLPLKHRWRVTEEVTQHSPPASTLMYIHVHMTLSQPQDKGRIL